MKIPDYPCIIRSLSKEEGGGYLIEYPDLPGCMSDGETALEAAENGIDAVQAWLTAARETNRHIPKPGELENQSGKWVQRVPKSMHLQLVNKAREEEVSLNTLVISMLAECLRSGQAKSHLAFQGVVTKRKQTDDPMDIIVKLKAVLDSVEVQPSSLKKSSLRGSALSPRSVDHTKHFKARKSKHSFTKEQSR